MKNILTLHIKCLEHTIDRSIKHIGNAQAGFGIKRHAPIVFKQAPCIAVADMAIARQFVREAAHVARALHIILPAQRVHANAASSDIACCHCKVGDGHDG